MPPASDSTPPLLQGAEGGGSAPAKRLGWAGWRGRVRATGRLLAEAVHRFQRDGADLLAASLSFHTLFSIAPLILISVAIAGLVLGRGAARAQVEQLLTEAMGERAARLVDGWVVQAAESSELASVVGVALLLLGASRLGTVLLAALNRVFGAAPEERPRLKTQLASYVKRRLIAAAMVLATGPLLLAVVASRALLTGFQRLAFAGSPWAGLSVEVSQWLLALWVVAGSCAVLYRWVPRARVSWRAAWVGALVASVLFNGGSALLALYLGNARVGAAYGLAGSVVTLLVWLQFSSAVFLLGAEFAQAFADTEK